MTRRFVQSLSGIALVIIMLYGCAAFNPQRVVNGNIFSSNYPKINVKISPQFRYIGHINYNAEAQDPQNLTSKSITVNDIYIFVPKEAKGQMGSAVLIWFSRLANPDWAYIGSVYNISSKIMYRYNVSTFAGQNYPTYTHLLNFRPHHQPFYDYIENQGLLASRLFIAQSYSKNVSSDTIVLIHYIEDVDITGFNKEQWFDKILLRDSQKQFLDNFEKRVSQTLEITTDIK